ncbi:MAG: GTPase Era, partial [Rhodospirillales bacterium]|nr:GTPase Era [Rhodospirillales bacterium]
MPEEASNQTRAGFVALLGAPNAGKSTLMNRLVGSKVSIVSPKVQTTRTRVLGICLKDASQVIFVDTPGIFSPRRRLDRAMVSAAWQGAGDADLIVLLIDAAEGMGDDTRRIIEGLKSQGRRAVAAINKVDAANKPDLLSLASSLDGEECFDRIFMISALDGTGTDDLLSYLAAEVPEGHWLFPEDQISDMPERLLAAEITREKLYLQLRQELPYRATVETESWEERKDGSVKIDQIIYVERDSHKRIILGK